MNYISTKLVTTNLPILYKIIDFTCEFNKLFAWRQDDTTGKFVIKSGKIHPAEKPTAPGGVGSRQLPFGSVNVSANSWAPHLAVPQGEGGASSHCAHPTPAAALLSRERHPPWHALLNRPGERGPC